MAAHLQRYEGMLMSPDMIRVCAGEATDVLGLPKAATDTVGRMLVRHWIDQRPDRKDVLRMCLRLREHCEDLKHGSLPAIWVGFPPTWTCAQVVHVVGLPKLLEVTFVCLAGILAGEALTYWLGTGYVMRLARELGAPRFAELEVRDILGFFLLAKFGQNRHNRQYLLETAIPESIKKLNRKLYRRRHGNGNRHQEEGR